MMKTTRWIVACVAGAMVLAGAWASAARAEESPTTIPASPSINWSATDLAGKEIKIPADKPAVLLFIRGDHAPSAQAIEQLKGLVSGKDLLVVAILSGKLAGEQAKTLSSLPWPIVLDPDYAASGKLNIHVWPTTVVIKSDGQQAAHVAGMPETYAASVEAYLAFAAGKIDQMTLNQRLNVREVVAESPKAKAELHLQVARRLMGKGQAEQARAELEEGLKISPEDANLQVGMAQTLLQLKQPKEAMAALEHCDKSAAPDWQLKLLRGKALVGLEKWEEAKAVLPDAIKLNPDPSEALYLLGQVYQHDNDLARAAESYRKAYEAATTAATRPGRG